MVDYSLNQARELDAGWHEMVVEWYAIQQAGPSIGATRGWKVFGEDTGVGGSDSCCVCTGVKYTDVACTEAIGKPFGDEAELTTLARTEARSIIQRLFS